MNNTTEELLIITLAIIILTATYITLTPTIIGFTIHTPEFTYNNNIINNNGIQLKQHNITESYTTNETLYYFLTFAEENGNDKLNKLIELDNNFLQLEKNKLLKIKFNNNLQNNNKINLYLKRNKEIILYICDFNAENSCNNETPYATLDYPGIEGNYQVILNLPEQTNEFTIDADKKIKIDYINASHLEITEHTNITYYYNSDSIESDIIQPQNLSKWDIFTADLTLNNQTINFYYKTAQDYIEFTPPYNFSEISSPALQFKLALNSDNTSTPIIHNLTINYIQEITPPCQENYTCTDWNECINETQTRTCTDINECGTQESKPSEQQDCELEEPPQETPPPSPASSGKPSVTRYKSSTPTQTESPKTQTKSVSQTIELKSAPEPQPIIETKKSNMKIIGNVIGISYLAFLCLLLYKRRYKL